MPRRRTDWCGTYIDNVSLGTIGSGGGSVMGSFVICSQSELANYAQPTIVRIRGGYYQGIDRSTVQQGDVNSTILLGIACVHPDMPTARDIAGELDNDDWMWIGGDVHGLTLMQDTAYNGTSVQLSAFSLHQFTEMKTIDVKAMRKAPDPCEVRLFWQRFEYWVDPPDDISLVAWLRVLVKD